MAQRDVGLPNLPVCFFFWFWCAGSFHGNRGEVLCKLAAIIKWAAAGRECREELLRGPGDKRDVSTRIFCSGRLDVKWSRRSLWHFPFPRWSTAESINNFGKRLCHLHQALTTGSRWHWHTAVRPIMCVGPNVFFQCCGLLVSYLSL